MSINVYINLMLGFLCNRYSSFYRNVSLCYIDILNKYTRTRTNIYKFSNSHSNGTQFLSQNMMLAQKIALSAEINANLSRYSFITIHFQIQNMHNAHTPTHKKTYLAILEIDMQAKSSVVKTVRVGGFCGII